MAPPLSHIVTHHRNAIFEKELYCNSGGLIIYANAIFRQRILSHYYIISESVSLLTVLKRIQVYHRKETTHLLHKQIRRHDQF